MAEIYARYMQYASVFSLSMAFFFMAFDQALRIYSYLFLSMFVGVSILAFISLRKVSELAVLNIRMKAVLGVISLLCFSQLYAANSYGSSISIFDTFRILYALPVAFGLMVVVNIWGHSYSQKLSFFIIMLSIVSLFLYAIGVYLDSTNFYASMLLIPAMYYLLSGRVRLFFIVAFFVFFLGVAFEARGAYMAMGIFISVYFLYRVIGLLPIVLLLGIIFLLVAQWYLISSHTLYADEVLSYRPTIWKYYYLESLDNIWLGNGPILSDISEGAAEFYQSMIGRGVGLAYGTQSMYMLYLYESGLPGLIGLLIILLLVFSTKSKYVVSVFTISILALLETVKIGAVSIYGLPLSYFIALSLASQRNEND